VHNVINLFFQGQVVTETSTEYRDVNDESDFVKLGKSSPPPSPCPVSNPRSESLSSDDESEGQFEDEALKAHNMYRAKHGVKPLKLD